VEGSAAEPKSRTASDGTVTVQSPESAPTTQPQNFESLSTWVLVDSKAPAEAQPTPSSKETTETAAPLPKTGTVAELMDLPALPPPSSGPTKAELDDLKRERITWAVALAMSWIITAVALMKWAHVI
jgi:hypothetical protein